MINLFVLLALMTSTLSTNLLPLNHSDNVLGSSDYLPPSKNIKTQSSFNKKEISEKETIKFKTQYKQNPDLDVDVEKITQEGKDGERVNYYEAIYWQENLTDKKLSRSEVKTAEDRIIEIGTKYTWKPINLAGSNIKYWKKINVWSTSYDAHCKGCTGRTYSGTEVKIGVCAVDPKVIPLGTSFYVPGYGNCHAEDIGGGIKGKHIDLGFADVKQGFWSARFTDIYLLDGEPHQTSF